jgi:hypothetical protein
MRIERCMYLQNHPKYYKGRISPPRQGQRIDLPDCFQNIVLSMD